VFLFVRDSQIGNVVSIDFVERAEGLQPYRYYFLLVAAHFLFVWFVINLVIWSFNFLLKGQRACHLFFAQRPKGKKGSPLLMLVLRVVNVLSFR
jgi:hypothetical protein